VLSQPPREALRASLPASVDLDELAREYFPRARRMLGASPMPDGVLKTPTYEAHRTAILEASRSGLRWERLEAGIDWDAVYRELRGEAPRSVVIGSYTFTGADSGALNSVDRNYLRLAEQSGRARVMPLHRVKLVRKLARGYELQVERLAENGEVLEEFVVECGALFLAAGSLGTTGLLFRSRRNGLKVNEHLGSSWGTNGVVIGQRLNIGPLGSIRGPFGPVAGGPPVVLVEQPDNPAGVTTLEYAGVYGEMMTIGMTVAAAGAGRLVYLPGQDETVPVWPVEAQSACRAAVAAVNKVLDAMPPGPQGPRLGRARIGLESQPGTAHPLGGAVLDQVCDGVGQVRGQEGLFVCDGALIPGCTGARNPALTITALAERNLDRILPTLTRLAGG
jgi:cholesterol oxidase